MNDLSGDKLTRPFCGRCRLSSQCMPLNNMRELAVDYAICRFCGDVFHVNTDGGAIAGSDPKKVASLYSICGAFVASALEHGNWIACSRDSCSQNSMVGESKMGLDAMNHLRNMSRSVSQQIKNTNVETANIIGLDEMSDLLGIAFKNKKNK